MNGRFSRIGRAFLLLVIIGLVASLQPSLTPAVLAHGDVVRSEPGPGSVLEQSPAGVTVWFTEPLEPQFGKIHVLDGQGRRLDKGDSAVDSQDPTVMSVSLPPLPNGTYTVAWTNVSTVDGHKVRGSFLFSVGEPISAASVSTALSQPLVQSPLEPVWRWLTLLSILAVVGGLGFELLILRPVLMREKTLRVSEILRVFPHSTDEPALRQLGEQLTCRMLKFTWLGLGLFLVASIGHLLVQTMVTYDLPLDQALGKPLTTLLWSTSWGHLWLWRIGLLLTMPAMLGLALVVSARQQARAGFFNRLAQAFGLVAGAGILLSLSLASHAAATGAIRATAVFNDYLHLLAASFWVGGLFQLTLAVPQIRRSLSGAQRRAVLAALGPRFSALAALSVATLIITGLYSAWAQVTILAAMATPYGQTLMAKLGLLLPMLILAGLNLLWLRPRLANEEKAGQWLGRFVTGEAILAILLLLPVGLLTALEPARQVASRQGLGQAIELTFQDAVEGTNIVLSIEPGQVGPNRFLVSLTDRRGQPISNASDVSLRATYLEADLGESSLSARSIGGGQYLIDDMSLAIAGPWQVALVARRPDAFDARTAFRFEVTPGSAASSASIAPAAITGRRLWAAELALLGLLLIAAAKPVGGYRSRSGMAVMAPGVVALLAGVLLAVNVRFPPPEEQEIALAAPLAADPPAAAAGQPVDTGPEEPEVAQRNPFSPDATSLGTGKRVYEQVCFPCHGATGRGDGPQAKGLLPRPVDLLEHLSLHAEAELFSIAHDGLVGTEMHTFGDTLTDEEIWHLVNYLGIFEADQHLAEKNYYQGQAFAAQGDGQQALASFGEAIELSPMYAAAYSGRGNVYRLLGKYEQAIADHSQAIMLKPDYAEAYYNRGVDYHEIRQPDRAIVDYNQAIELEPDAAPAYFARGLAYVGAGDLAQAIFDFNKAIDTDPSFSRAYLERGLAYYDSGEPEQALGDLEHYLELVPEAENRETLANLIANLEAGLSQASPPSGQAALTLADFPPGFEAIPTARLGLSPGRTLHDSLTIERGFAFGATDPFEVVWGLTTLLPAAREQADFEADLHPDELLAFLNEGLGGAEILEQKALPELAGLGEVSVGLSVAFAGDGGRTRVDAAAFRRGSVGAFMFVMYPDGEAPAVPIGDVARKLAERLAASR